MNPSEFYNQILKSFNENNVEYVIIGYNDLLKNKYNSNRTKDLLDVKELKEIEKIIKKSDKNRPK